MADNSSPNYRGGQRGGFRGRGRGRGRGSGTEEPVADSAPAKTEALPETAKQEKPPANTNKQGGKKTFIKKGEVNLKPQRQSTTNSEEKNDPLVNSMLLIPGVAGFVERIGTREFQLDYSQFVDVVRTSYDAQVTFDRSLKKYLPFSFYQYYAVIMLWRRLMTVVAARGIHLLERQELEARFFQDTPIPEDIQLYLSGIGDIVDSNARQFELALQVVPEIEPVIGGAQGSFGPVNVDTHILYETIPSPLVTLLKIRADLEYTTALLFPDQALAHPDWLQPDWNLPAGLAPGAPAQMPTANLLGWSTRERLAPDAIDALSSAMLTLDQFGTDNIFSIPLNVKLLEYVANMLRSSKCTVKGQLPEARTGSLAQVPFLTRAVGDTQPQPYKSIATKRGITNSYTQSSVHIACSAATFRYRIQRRTQIDQIDNLCYRFQAQPPAAWLQNENDVFIHGVGQQLWNNNQFTIGEQDGHALTYKLALSVRRNVTRD